MGKTRDHLENQLSTEYKQGAEDCIKIYDKLKEMNNGHVWESQWRLLVNVKFVGGEMRYSPSPIGQVFLEGLST